MASFTAAYVAAFTAFTTSVRGQVMPEPRPAITAAEKEQGYSSRTLLAKPRADETERELALHESREGVRVRRTFRDLGNLRVLEPAAGETVPEAIERLRATGRYEFVEPNYLMKAEATPNDPRYLVADQWSLRNVGQSNGTAGADIRAEEAWEVQRSASNVVVALIDSGIRRTHEDLAGNLWVNPNETAGNNRDDDGNGYIDDVNGIDSTVALNSMGNGNPNDVEGHGTAVASVIGAVGNNGLGMTGVAWNVKLMALRFLDAYGFGFISDEIECIDYAIAKRAQIINASFGGTNYSQALFDAFKRARDAGIIVVCAAGNDGRNSDVFSHYPSNYLLDNLVAVANTTRNDALATTSGYGAGMIDLGAPGTSILTADYSSDRSYEFYSGTSFSAPMVSGALALLKAKFPNDTYRETINRLLSSVDRKPSLAGKLATGGRLNLAAALKTTHGRPFNDDFARRSEFNSEVLAARSAAHGATREAGEPIHAGVAGNGSLWWGWQAPRSGPVTIETTGSAIDTLLAVYTGTALDALSAVASNDDQSSALNTSKLTFNAVAGTHYQIAVDNKGTTAGIVVLRLNLQSGNDDFASAQLVTGRSWAVHADNRVATREPGEPRIRNNTGGSSVWYRWVAPATRRYHIASYSSNFNTMLGIYTGSSLSTLTEIAAVTTAGDSNFTMSSAGTTLSATAGTTYYIVIDKEVSSTGASSVGEFRLSCIDSDWEYFGFGDISTVAVAADDTLHFVDALGYLYALNTDGSRKWRHTLTGFGTYSAPTVASDGTVYVGDDLGYLHAVTSSGARKWRISTSYVVQCSPAIGPDGTVYLRSEDGRLQALNPDNGVTKWTFRMGASDFGTYSSPVVAPDGTIYCAGNDSKLYAITPTGTQKWSYSTDFILASPALAADGTIYIGVVAPTRRLLALRPDGALKWDFVAGDTISSSAAVGLDGSIYFGCADNKLYAVAPTGQLRWTYEAGGPIHISSPVIASDGAIYIGSSDGKVHCVESNGTLRRSYSTAHEVRASPILHNGRLFLSSYDYRLYSIDVGQVAASTAWPMHRQNLARTARPVASALKIGVQPRGATAELGEVVTLHVGALGSSPLTYQWMFNGQAIAGATATTYGIDPVIHARGGQYSVRVSDSTGSLTSSAATLTVSTPLVPPSIFTAPAAQTMVAGNHVTLVVGATGTTPMTYQWLRDGEPIAGATSPSLTLTDARPALSGNYAVAITNFAGTIHSAAVGVTINSVSRISNLSIRSQVGGSAGTLTVGLTIGGADTTGQKPLLLRATGPTLAEFGLTGALADPRLAILAGSTVMAQNDDWAGSAEVKAANAAVGAFPFAAETSKDAALAHSTTSGGYTVQITGAGTSSGVALAEVYDTTPSDNFVYSTPRLTNVSALTEVGTGGDVLIAGFAITGTTSKTVLVRGIGPTLAGFGVGGALADPKLELFNAGASTAMSTNDDWGAATNATQIAAAAVGVGAFPLASGSKDAVLLVTLPPGSYTAQISGVNNTTGTAMVEVYEVP